MPQEVPEHRHDAADLPLELLLAKFQEREPEIEVQEEPESEVEMQDELE